MSQQENSAKNCTELTFLLPNLTIRCISLTLTKHYDILILKVDFLLFAERSMLNSGRKFTKGYGS